MINVKLCRMVVLIKLDPFIPVSVTMIEFKGHSSVKQFELKILRSYPTELKFCLIVDYIKCIMNIPLVFFIFAHV